ITHPPPPSPPFPYTTLFRSHRKDPLAIGRKNRLDWPLQIDRRIIAKRCDQRQLARFFISRKIADRLGRIARDDGLHAVAAQPQRSEEHTSELQSQSNLVCRL